ncbi:MFS transporter [Nocardioides anomalus]|uniref:MFS transporter n=1 Tax=Nocardioides anomalus TaxID=2712223 RepID=A0A6G6WHB2_9ACTN|nr:MFS transporter [Nocardioides anomalus]QIG44596.1 MFS transporter [Nocardioides anomalus]
MSTTTTRVDNQAGLTAALVLVVVCVGVVSSLGAPLIPAIAESRHVSPSAAQWSLTITLLTGAVLAPVLGRLGDGPRRREVVLVTLALVAAGCVLAAPDWGFATLLVGRALQGLGLGLMPLGVAVLRDHLDPPRVRRAVVLVSISSVAGAGVGYPVSGALAAVGGVGASFWFGAGVVVVALAVAARVLPTGRHLDRAHLDVPGAVLLGLGVAGLLLVLSQGRQWGWSSPEVVALAVLSPALLAVFVRHEQRAATPLVDLRLLRHGPVLVADLTALTAGVGVYLLMSSVSWLLQSPATGGGFGLSTLVAAGAMVPFSVTSVATAQLAVPRLVERLGDAWSMPIGCLVFAVSMGLLAVLRDQPWQAYLVMGVGGVGAGCTFSSMPSVIVRAVPSGEVGSATGLNQVMRSIGYATGAAAFAAVLAAYADPRTGSTPPGGFAVAAWIGVAVFAGTAMVDLVLLRGRRAPARHEPELVTPP